jgi:hypothetical protein
MAAADEPVDSIGALEAVCVLPEPAHPAKDQFGTMTTEIATWKMIS